MVYFCNGFRFIDSNYHVTQTNVNFPQSVPQPPSAHQTSDRQSVCQIGVSI